MCVGEENKILFFLSFFLCFCKQPSPREPHPQKSNNLKESISPKLQEEETSSVSKMVVVQEDGLVTLPLASR